MQKWNATTQALPAEGDFVQFVVDERNVVLRGTYEQCAFKSRWSQYSAAEVSEWRKLGEAPASWTLALKMMNGAAASCPSL